MKADSASLLDQHNSAPQSQRGNYETVSLLQMAVYASLPWLIPVAKLYDEAQAVSDAFVRMKDL